LQTALCAAGMSAACISNFCTVYLLVSQEASSSCKNTSAPIEVEVLTTVTPFAMYLPVLLIFWLVREKAPKWATISGLQVVYCSPGMDGDLHVWCTCESCPDRLYCPARYLHWRLHHHLPSEGKQLYVFLIISCFLLSSFIHMWHAWFVLCY
jgi:hypothetical protein